MAAAADNRHELQELLPFYVNGTLEAEERARVDAALQDDTRLRDEARMLEHLRHTIRASDTGATPGAFGLARLMRDIDRAEAPPRRAALLPWGLTIAASAALLAVALGWIGGDRTAPYLQASGDADGAYLTVAFQPEAAQSDVSALLLDQGLAIVEGPSAIGLYRVDPGAGRDLDALVAELRARADIIESVDLP